VGGLGGGLYRDYIDLLGSGASATPCEPLAVFLFRCWHFGPRATGGAVHGCQAGEWGVRWLGKTLGF
jgi:hypothetical protein